MPTPAILPSQRNEILRLLSEKGFSPTEFQWRDTSTLGDDEGPTVTLTHQGTGFFCSFSPERNDSGKPYTRIEHFPSDAGTVKRERVDSSYTWNSVVQKWVQLLRQEVDTPDLWASVTSSQNQVVQATATASENTPFTEQERIQVALFLTEVRNYIEINAHLSPEKLDVIGEKLEYLTNATERFGRKDWLNLFLGVLFSTAVQVGMERSVFQDLLSFAGQMFRQILQQIILLPLPH